MHDVGPPGSEYMRKSTDTKLTSLFGSFRVKDASREQSRIGQVGSRAAHHADSAIEPFLRQTVHHFQHTKFCAAGVQMIQDVQHTKWPNPRSSAGSGWHLLGIARPGGNHH
jgi:hypothetical protein